MGKTVNKYTLNSLVSDLFFRPIRCMDMFLITKILELANVHNYMRCLSQNKSDTKHK